MRSPVPQDESSQLLLEASEELLLLVNPSTLRIAAANPHAESLLGLTVDEYHGSLITDVETALQDVFFWEEVRQGDRPEMSAVEGLYRHRDGRLFPVEKTVRLIHRGRRLWYLIRAVDITQRQAIEDELANTTSMLSATIEAVADGILATDLGGNVLRFNRSFAQLFGFTRDSGSLLTRQDWQSLIKNLLIGPEVVLSDWPASLEQADSPDGITLETRSGASILVRTRPQWLGGQLVGHVWTFSPIPVASQATSDTAAVQALQQRIDALQSQLNALRAPQPAADTASPADDHPSVAPVPTASSQ